MGIFLTFRKMVKTGVILSSLAIFRTLNHENQHINKTPNKFLNFALWVKSQYSNSKWFIANWLLDTTDTAKKGNLCTQICAEQRMLRQNLKNSWLKSFSKTIGHIKVLVIRAIFCFLQLFLSLYLPSEHDMMT